MALTAPSQLQTLSHRPARLSLWDMDAAGRPELAGLSPDRLCDAARRGGVCLSDSGLCARPYRRGYQRPLFLPPDRIADSIRSSPSGPRDGFSDANRLG